MVSLYTLLPLHQPGKQIRLLQVEPVVAGSDDLNLRAAVHEFDGGNRTPYIAISYTWGAYVPVLPITVNECKIQVQLNCWYALWQMRYHGYTSDKNVWIWIDSLSINQADNNEKQCQVSIMGAIYSSAMWVASSLGTGDTVGMMRTTLESRDLFARKKLRDRFDHMPYFNRVWIKQEVVLARDIILFWGTETMAWQEFARAINAISNDQESGNSDSETRQYAIRRGQYKMHSNTEQLCTHRSEATRALTFMDLIIKYEETEATNPRDKIYALLPLLPTGDLIRQNLPIIYESGSAFHLFRNIVKLVYITYNGADYGQKHRALGIIQQFLNVEGHDENMISYFDSDTMPGSKHRDDEFVTVDVEHLIQLLGENDAPYIYDHEYGVEATPTRWEEISQLIKPLRRGNNTKNTTDSMPLTPSSELKEIKVLFKLKWKGTFADSLKKKIFLVDKDVKAGDLLALLVWDKGDLRTGHGRSFAHAILRKVKIDDSGAKGGYNAELPQGIKPDEVAFVLHSWAVSMTKTPKILFQCGKDSKYLDALMKQTGKAGRLRLHYHDALLPLLLNHDPLSALFNPMAMHSSESTRSPSRMEGPGLISNSTHDDLQLGDPQLDVVFYSDWLDSWLRMNET